uniref:Uncharacterized protein n=1 Tax=Haptolina ericina TaxID=156174 RepID=A0A7S3AZN6_9EUKA
MGSIAPLSSVVHVSAAAAQLLLAPLRPAPLRGLSHGGDAFARAVGIEALSLTSGAVNLLHTMLGQLDCAIAPIVASPRYPQATVASSLSHLSAASDAALSLRNAIDKRRVSDESTVQPRD